MKQVLAWLVAFPLIAAEIEGTAWYDAEGKLVVVEGASAESAPTPFVAEWRKREIERRERQSGSWTTEIQPFYSRGYRSRRGYRYGGHWGYRPRYYSGHRHYYGGSRHRCGYGYRSGGSVIIRW